MILDAAAAEQHQSNFHSFLSDRKEQRQTAVPASVGLQALADKTRAHRPHRYNFEQNYRDIFGVQIHVNSIHNHLLRT